MLFNPLIEDTFSSLKIVRYSQVLPFCYRLAKGWRTLLYWMAIICFSLVFSGSMGDWIATQHF